MRNNCTLALEGGGGGVLNIGVRGEGLGLRVLKIEYRFEGFVLESGF